MRRRAIRPVNDAFQRGEDRLLAAVGSCSGVGRELGFVELEGRGFEALRVDAGITFAVFAALVDALGHFLDPVRGF